MLMPVKLTTTVNKIVSIPNWINSTLLLSEFYQYRKSNGAAERHQNNNLKAVITFANFQDTDTTFLDVELKEQITSFLDTKIKNEDHGKKNGWFRNRL
jgi:hypothetical protein